MIHPDELKVAPIFACLSDAHRERIAQNAAELFVKEGEWLIREGEAPWFFVLLEGCLDVEKEYGASSVVRARYRPGEFYGETPILLNSPAIASLRAHEKSRVVRLDRMQFRELIDSSPECSDLVVKVMMKRVTMMQENMRETNPLRVLVIGPPYDADCRDIREFLSMNRIPYEWQHENHPAQMSLGVPPDSPGPFVVIDRAVLVNPLTVRKLADALGLSTSPKKDRYDVVVVGGGPAGLAAAVYGASEGLSVLLVEKNAPGGQAGTSSRIENYPGFPTGISGDDLSARFLKQATRFGAEMVLTRAVEKIEPTMGGYRVEFDGGLHVKTKTIVLATGVDWRRLEADGVDRLQGKGVLYGATRMEATAVVGKDVFIVGGGNSAGQAAMFFSGYAATVTLLVRGKDLDSTMSQYLIDQLAERHNIFVETETRVVSVLGDDCIESIETDTKGRSSRFRKAHALFIMIGARANTNWLPKDLERDDHGFVCTGRDLPHSTGTRMPFLLETNLPGLFCAGDVRHDSIKRVSSSVGEGSMAIAFVHQYLALQARENEAVVWQLPAEQAIVPVLS